MNCSENIDLVWKIGSMCEAYVYEKCVRNIKEVILTKNLKISNIMDSYIFVAFSEE